MSEKMAPLPKRCPGISEFSSGQPFKGVEKKPGLVSRLLTLGDAESNFVEKDDKKTGLPKCSILSRMWKTRPNHERQRSAVNRGMDPVAFRKGKNKEKSRRPTRKIDENCIYF